MERELKRLEKEMLDAAGTSSSRGRELRDRLFQVKESHVRRVAAGGVRDAEAACLNGVMRRPPPGSDDRITTPPRGRRRHVLFVCLGNRRTLLWESALVPLLGPSRR